MTWRILNNGQLVEPSKLTIRQSGINRNIRRLSVWHDGALRTVKDFVDDLSVNASPSLVTGTTAGGGTQTATTGSTTASPDGGIGPYQYAWALISSSGGNTPVALSPANASTQFRQTGLAPNTGSNAVFRVTVTDSFGATATAEVTAIFEHLGNFE